MRYLKLLGLSVALVGLLLLLEYVFFPGTLIVRNSSNTGAVQPASCLKDQDKKDPYVTPVYRLLVVDLESDGIEVGEVESSRTYFSINGDDSESRVGWPNKSDGIVVVLSSDLDEQPSFWSPLQDLGDANDPLGQLEALDENGDGRIDNRDSTFMKLAIWQDSDADADIDEGERQSLDAFQVEHITLVKTDADDGAGQTQDKSAYLVYDVDKEMVIAEVQLPYSTSDVFRPVKLSFGDDLESRQIAERETRNLPNLRGWGNVPPLMAALQHDTTLRAMVVDYIRADRNKSIQFHREQIEQILYHWAGTEDVPLDSRGCYFDGRKLDTLEKFWGEPWRQLGEYVNPSPQAAPFLEEAWRRHFNYYLLRFNEVFYNFFETPFEGVNYRSGNLIVRQPDALVKEWVKHSPVDPESFSSYWYFRSLALSDVGALRPHVSDPYWSPLIEAMFGHMLEIVSENGAENVQDVLAKMAIKAAPIFGPDHDDFLKDVADKFGIMGLTEASQEILRSLSDSAGS